MKQIGTVVEINGDIARVECDRQSACDMCENAAGCAEKCKKVCATASNTVNATVGDRVEIETDTSKVLKNAFIVFLLPIVFAIASYFLAKALLGESLAIVVTFIVLVFSLLFLSFVLNKAEKKQAVSRIVRIL